MPVMPAPTTSTSTSGCSDPISIVLWPAPRFVPTGLFYSGGPSGPEVVFLGDDHHPPARIHEPLLVVAQDRALLAEIPLGPEPHAGQVGEADLGDAVVRGLGSARPELQRVVLDVARDRVRDLGRDRAVEQRRVVVLVVLAELLERDALAALQQGDDLDHPI